MISLSAGHTVLGIYEWPPRFSEKTIGMGTDLRSVYIPDPTSEPSLCLSSLVVGIAVPLILVILGLWMKNRRSFSLGIIVWSVFVFYMAYSYYAHLYSWDPEYATGPRAWLVVGLIVVGTASLIIGLLILGRRTAIGTRFVDWLMR